MFQVVELSTSEFTQSLALTFFLKIAHSNSNLYTEFIKKDFSSLIGPVIRSTRCIKGIILLNSILETACDKPVLTRRSEGFFVVPTTNANIVHPNLLMSIIQRYSDWHVPKCNDSSILATLLETIQALVREKHPRQVQNIQCLSKAGLIPTLLNFCKIHLVGVPEPVFLSRQAAESIVNLISIFAGSPPSPQLLDDIIKVLLLLHRPSESFITHDRSKFYFLISSMVLVKQKRISLPMTTRKLGISIRRERKNTVPMRSFKSPKAQPTRSVSLDHSLNNQIDVDSPMNLDDQQNLTKENESPQNPTKENESPQNLTKENESTIENPSQVTPSEYPPSDGFDTIVTYTGVDRRMRKLLNPGQPSSPLLNLQLKKRTYNKKKRTRKSHSTTDSDNEKETKPKGLNCELKHSVKNKKFNYPFSGTISESGIEADMHLVRDFEIIAIEDVRRMEERLRFKFQRQDLPFENTQFGITQLQNGFFNLLRDFILILPDASIQEVRFNVLYSKTYNCQICV